MVVMSAPPRLIPFTPQTAERVPKFNTLDPPSSIKKMKKLSLSPVAKNKNLAIIKKNFNPSAVKPKVNSWPTRLPSTRPPVKKIPITRTPVNKASITRPTFRRSPTPIPTKRKSNDFLTGRNVRSRVSLTVTQRLRATPHSKLDQINRKNTLNIPSNKTVSVSAIKPSMLRQPTVYKATRNVITNDQVVLSKIETTSIPIRKRKNEEDTPTIRNVRNRVSDDLKNRSNQADVYLSEIQIERAFAIAESTSLEMEEEQLKYEYNHAFSDICSLEHVLACEQYDATSLFDEAENKRSEYSLYVQERAELMRNQQKFIELDEKADLELDEMAKLLDTNNAQLENVTKLLDEKVHSNAVLNSSINELKKMKRSSRRYKK